MVKAVRPGTVAETGGSVTYTYTLTNTSPAGSFDPLTLTSLSDDKAGNILTLGTFTGGDTDSNGKIDAGQKFSCALCQAIPAGNATGGSFTNTVTVNAVDDEGSAASASD